MKHSNFLLGNDNAPGLTTPSPPNPSTATTARTKTQRIISLTHAPPKDLPILQDARSKLKNVLRDKTLDLQLRM